MKYFLTLFYLLFLVMINAQSNTTYQSKKTFEETFNTIKQGILAKNIKIFAEIDHSQEAEKIGLPLNKTKVLILGNPQVGTAIMQDNPYTAIELPLKILILEVKGKTEVIYKNIAPLSNEYPLQNKEILIKIDENMNKLIQNILNN